LGSLSRTALASEAGSTVERVDELVRVGVLRPEPDGSFTPPDVARIRLAAAYEAAGVGIDLIGHAVAQRWVTFERIDDLYRDSGPRSRRTVAEFRASLGPRGHLLAPLLAALGLPSPDDDSVLTARDEERLTAFLGAWDVGDDPDVTVRAGRLIGEAMRRTVAGWLELFAEQVTRPLEDRTRTIDEMTPIVVPRAATIISETPDLLRWLFQRHLEAGMDAQNVASMETGLAREGLLPPRPATPPAIAFVDLAGYTRLTETGGDELAARSAARLAELADEAARPHGGRLVKLLGDGAMLHFRNPNGAVRATLDLVDAIAQAGLPAGHAGVAAGPLVGRDGDFFGHTVNLAARLSGIASAGVILVTREVTDAVGRMADGIRFEPIGEVALKNVAAPVEAFRAERAG
jgi:class 3 adenylate cyclase